MAITILKTTNFKKEPDSKIVLPLRKTINLKIKADGSVVNADGTMLTTLNLGVQGDDRATIIHFDLEDLYIRGLLRNEMDSYANNLTEHYQPIIYCQLDDDTIQKYEFDGVHFYIPSTLSSNTKNVKLLYTLKELYRGEENKDNITEEIEDFVSAEIRGSFDYNMLLPFLDDANIYNEIEVKHETLKKPTIYLNFNAKKALEIDSIGGQSLGYAQDRKITDIQLSGLYADEEISYIVYFYNPDIEGIIGAVADKNDKLWIPVEITQNAGNYTILVYAATTNGEEFYSNTIQMKVVENFLYKGALVDLGAIVKTKDDEIIYVLAEVEDE